MDRKTILAMVLSFGVLLGWQKFYVEPRMQAAQTAQQASQAVQAGPNTQGMSSVAPEQTIAPGPVQTLALSTATGTVKVSDRGQIFAAWDLNDYRESMEKSARAVDLQSVSHESGQGYFAFDLPEFSYLASVVGKLEKTADGARWSYEDQKLSIVREFRVPSKESAHIEMSTRISFKNGRPNYAFLSLDSRMLETDVDAPDRQIIYFTENDIQRKLLSDLSEPVGVPTPVRWAGVTDRYFVLAAVNDSSVSPTGLVQTLGENRGRVSLAWPVTGETFESRVKVYFGPKELDQLRGVDASLETTVDFGWFTAFAYPLLRLMKWIHGWAGNWGVAIVLLTLIVKLLTFPLTYKSMKSMKQMAALQPQINKLREKYGDDKEALNREMMTLMRTEGYNPLAGCLPILIQMPVFFALYRVLYSAIELYQAPFFLWIHDLSAKDPYYVTPVLLTAIMYIQQKLTPNTATDPVQAKMIQFMPVIFGVFMLTLPSGLTVYMLVNALASIVQQLILNKKLDIKPVAPAVAGAL